MNNKLFRGCCRAEEIAGAAALLRLNRQRKISLSLTFLISMWRKPRPRWSGAESRCAAQLRMERVGGRDQHKCPKFEGKNGIVSFRAFRLCSERIFSNFFFKNNRHHIVCLSINRQSRVTLMVVSLL